MEILGPKYPFEPLPPPEDLANRNLAVQEKRNASLEKSSEPLTRRPDFKALLKEKTEARENPVEDSAEIRKLQQAAQDLEAFFLYSILKDFNSSSMKSDLFPKAPGRDMYMDMFFEGVSEEMAKRPDGFGLAKLIVESAKASMIQSAVNEDKQSNLSQPLPSEPLGF